MRIWQRAVHDKINSIKALFFRLWPSSNLSRKRDHNSQKAFWTARAFESTPLPEGFDQMQQHHASRYTLSFYVLYLLNISYFKSISGTYYQPVALDNVYMILNVKLKLSMKQDAVTNNVYMILNVKLKLSLKQDAVTNKKYSHFRDVCHRKRKWCHGRLHI